MIRFARPLAFATALALSAAVPAAAQDFSAAQRGEIEKIIRDYLIKHPEVLQEAMAELEKKQQVAEGEKARSAIKTHSEAIFTRRATSSSAIRRATSPSSSSSITTAATASARSTT